MRTLAILGIFLTSIVACCGTPATAQVLFAKIGAWSVYFDKGREFPGVGIADADCTAISSYNNGRTNLSFVVSSSYMLSIVLTDVSWRIDRNATYDISIGVDGSYTTGRGSSIGVGLDIYFSIDDGGSIIRKLMTAHYIDVKSNGGYLSFSLPQMPIVVESLMRCVQYYSIPPQSTTTNPFVPPSNDTGPPEDQE